VAGGATSAFEVQAPPNIPATTQPAAKLLVGQVLEEIAATLERGEPVKLSSFGSFTVQQKKERIGRNLKTGELAPISARRTLRFKPSLALKNALNS
jgi:integration host factor subunit alpha